MSKTSIGAILDGLYFEARTQRGKGTSFERMVRQFLLTEPQYAERFDEVWMWVDWPGRSALDWLLDRYQVKTDKASGIVNDPNDWMAEGAGAEPGIPAQPLYLLDLIARVTTVSVRTQQIVADLPPLGVRD